MYLIFALMVLSTLDDKLSINFMSRATYRAATRGFEVHLVDLFALILFIGMLMRPNEFKKRAILPLTFPYLAFIVIGLISWITIWNTEGYSLPNPTARLFPEEQMPSEFEIGLYPLFEISKILRGFFVYWTVTHFFTDKKTIKTLLISFAIILLFFTIGSTIDRYVFGTFRTAFILDTNIFNCYVGMIGAFITPFIFQSTSWFLSFGFAFLVLCSVVCVIFTVSRSSLLGLLSGSAVATFFSLRRFRQRKNLVLIFLLGLMILAMLAKAAGTLSERFFHAETVSAGLEIREKYIIEAKEMGTSHLFGVGLGNFSAFGQDEYSQLLEGDVNSSMAHNIWYLTFGESGWLGLVAFAILWIRFFQLLFSAMMSKKLKLEPLLYATLLGVLGAVIMLHIQSLFHFAFRVTPIYFLFHILAGLMTRIYLMDKKQWLIK